MSQSRYRPWLRVSDHHPSYIHAGAWRDPRNTISEFQPTVKHLAETPDLPIAGFVSLNYRLSPHPDFPQDADTTAPEELRVARHPDHVSDIWSALSFLQSHVPSASSDGVSLMGGPYVLMGYSAGATLAMQVLMGSYALGGSAVPRDVRWPTVVVGMSGIYEFESFARRHGEYYQGLMRTAFGDDEGRWNDAAPMCWKGKFGEEWEGGKGIVLSWGNDDELIDEPEISGMTKKLESDGVRLELFMDFPGVHEAGVHDGKPVADLVAKTFRDILGAA